MLCYFCYLIAVIATQNLLIIINIEYTSGSAMLKIFRKFIIIRDNFSLNFTMGGNPINRVGG